MLERKKDNSKACNWWCRNKRHVFAAVGGLLTGGVIGAAIALGGSLMLEARIAANPNEFDFDSLGLNITPRDEMKLTGFVTGLFTPWFTSILQSVDGEIIKKQGVFSRGRGGENPVIIAVNDARKNIEIMRIWLNNSTKNSFWALSNQWSRDALTARNMFVEHHLEILEDAITDYLTKKGVTDSGASMSFDPSQTSSIYGFTFTWSGTQRATYREIDPTSVNIDLSQDPVEIVMPDLPPDPETEDMIIEDPNESTGQGIYTPDPAKQDKKIPVVLHVLGWGFVALLGKKILEKKSK